MTDYTNTIHKYVMDDRFTGKLADPDGSGEVGLGAGEAGHKLAVRFMLKCTGERVTLIRYQVFGCGYTMAACAAAAELSEGVLLAELKAWPATVIEQHLGGLPPERAYCAELAIKALHAAADSVHQRTKVTAAHDPEEEHEPRLAAHHPTYKSLVASANPNNCTAEDRHLFACLLTIASSEAAATHAALGLAKSELEDLVRYFFPLTGWQARQQSDQASQPPEVNLQVRVLLHEHVAASPDRRLAGWLTDILAARAAHPGHLWMAMGLFERPELTAAIGRILPSLLAANTINMRWKRFFFKQLCDRNGGSLCKSPVCGNCSDYTLCFAEKN